MGPSSETAPPSEPLLLNTSFARIGVDPRSLLIAANYFIEKHYLKGAFEDAKGKQWKVKSDKNLLITFTSLETPAKELQIDLDESGQVIAVKLDGLLMKDSKSQILEEFAPVVLSMVKKIFELTSSYGEHTYIHSLRICLSLHALMIDPEYHLDQFSLAITQLFLKYDEPSILVILLQDDLTAGPATDLGGPSRDYVAKLAEGLVKKSDLLNRSPIWEKASRGPRGKMPLLSPLSSAQIKALHQFGQLMMFCLHSASDAYQAEVKLKNRDLVLGRCLHDAVFKAILSLTAQEIDTPYSELSLKTKANMCKALMEGHKVSTGPSIELSEFLLQDSLNESQIRRAVEIAGHAECLDDELAQEGVYLNPEKRQAVLNCMGAALLELNTSEIGQMGNLLPSIHALAGGMKSICCLKGNVKGNESTWDQHFHGNIEDYYDISQKVQGVRDRKLIADNIILYDGLWGTERIEIQKKVDWLKEWLLNEATSEQVDLFIMYVTGSSSLPSGQVIHVGRQVADKLTPLPKVQTCSFEMQFATEPCGWLDTKGVEIYNDRTKEGFIKTLVEYGLAKESVYGTQ